jgi:uncharacterized protein YndB with AHSA1/START domain
MSDAKSDDTALRLERLIASPPETVFALWIEPAELARWWAPDGYQAEVDALDVRPGGRWRVVLRGAANSVAMSGAYRIVEPPRRLVFSWAWEDPSGARGHDTEVTVNFEAAPGGTRLVLEHRHFENSQARDRHDAGWAASFTRLAYIAERQRP